MPIVLVVYAACSRRGHSKWSDRQQMTVHVAAGRYFLADQANVKKPA